MNIIKVLLITVIFFLDGTILFGQCNENFKFDTTVSEENRGKIHIEIEGGKSPYTFKTFQLDSKEIKLVNTAKISGLEKNLVIENLVPGYYLIQVEFGASCRQTIGGLDGILIKSNKDE